MNLCNIRRTFVELRPKRGWKTIYWMVDVHGVIIPGSWHNENEFRFISADCISVLQWITRRSDQRLILWTSSFEREISKLSEWLKTYNIRVDYINDNPEEKGDPRYADFSKKPYFNILIDDKAGFEPSDWIAVKQELIDIGEW